VVSGAPGLRSADFGFGISVGGGKVGKLGRLRKKACPSSVQPGARKAKAIGGQGLTDLGMLAKLSVSFRFFPKLSVSFRFFPFCSAWCRLRQSEFRNPQSEMVYTVAPGKETGDA